LNWIKDPSAKTHRYLHAVVNNAGIGAPGLIDWSSMSAYEKVMDGKFRFFLYYIGFGITFNFIYFMKLINHFKTMNFKK